MQSALNDAQKCINLKPFWSKGYARKAVALVGLKRIPMAIAAYTDGLKVDPHNQQLLSALAELRGEKKEEAPHESKAGEEAVPAEKAAAAAEGETEAPAAVQTPAEELRPPKAPTPPPMAEEELELLSSFLSETSDLERKQQVERIIKYKLNPFEVSDHKVQSSILLR